LYEKWKNEILSARIYKVCEEAFISRRDIITSMFGASLKKKIRSFFDFPTETFVARAGVNLSDVFSLQNVKALRPSAEQAGRWAGRYFESREKATIRNNLYISFIRID